MGGEQQKHDWSALKSQTEMQEGAFMDYMYPKISIIIPTHNSSQWIGLTLSKVLEQAYPDFEVIIIDAGSTDRTLSIINSYLSKKIMIGTVTEYHLYEMMNKGISLAMGKYISFLEPGDFYLNYNTMKQMMNLAIENQNPHLIFGGSIIRDSNSHVKVHIRDLSISVLRQGFQPSSLEACFFRADLFRLIGKFPTYLEMRGGFDLFCRFSLSPGLQYISTSQIVSDYESKPITRKKVFLHFKETLQVIYKYFGFWAALKWLTTQKDLSRFFNLWLERVKIAILGREVT